LTGINVNNSPSDIQIPDREIEITAIRSQGKGGQNVNKVATAAHLRFDIKASSLPAEYKEKLLALSDNRITADGVIIIKAQRFRTQEKNREDAVKRLYALFQKAFAEKKKRKPTRVSQESKKKRVDNKVKRGQLKALRSKVQI
jgi:ribosome-associated protein